jgi:hypothetical protein
MTEDEKTERSEMTELSFNLVPAWLAVRADPGGECGIHHQLSPSINVDHLDVF